MIVNGKEVRANFRQAEQIQNKINNVEQLPANAKTEVSKKDKNDLLSIVNDDGSANFNGYSIENNTFGINSVQNRKDRYGIYGEMDELTFVHRGLQIVADDCTQKNLEGSVYTVHSDDDEGKAIIEELFERLNINRELWSIFFETCKDGDNFYEVIPDSYAKPTQITSIRYLETDRVNRIEKNGKLAFYTYTADLNDPNNQTVFDVPDDAKKADDERIVYKLEPWQIIHFKIPGKKFAPYGRSLLDPGVPVFKKLSLLENGMVIYRLTRVPEKRVFKIDVGNLPTSEANRQVQNIKNNYRTTQILDDRGNINRTASALSLNQDIYIPVRDGGRGTSIETLSPGKALDNIDDIRYFRDQILWTMNIPPHKLGFTSDQAGAAGSRNSLAMDDLNFGRFAERIQEDILDGLIKLASIELFFKHKKKSDLKNFKIELTPPSNIREVMDITLISNKMQLIQSMTATGMFPAPYILKNVMGLSKKEINNILFYKDIENEKNKQQEQQMNGGMGMGMPMDSGMGGAPMDMNAPQPVPAASVETNMEDKMVNLFGKDILIENKEDWSKILNAYYDYENQQKNTKHIPTLEEILDEPMENSILTEKLQGIFYEKKEIKTNNRTTSLFIENELGGLSFSDSTLKIFSKKKKGKTESILEEEIKI